MVSFLKQYRVKILILMASYNGVQWIADQLDSILGQLNVDITINISDDLSSDGSFEYLKNRAENDCRLVLLDRVKSGSSGKNFYRLVSDVDTSGFDYVAFADQDDIWNLDKLSRHVALIKSENAECVSSNVMAFWPDGSKKLICKSQAQKSHDFIFEAAGPGCSVLMTPWLLNKLREELQSSKSPAKNVLMHDWLTYAICRAHQRKWLIDPVPSLMYRQHANNVIGANSGIRAILYRIRKSNDGWYRDEVSKICDVVIGINPDPYLVRLSGLLKARTFLSQLKLLPYTLQARRKLIDQVVLGLYVLLFIF